MYPSPASCPRAPECVEEFHQLCQIEVRAHTSVCLHSLRHHQVVEGEHTGWATTGTTSSWPRQELPGSSPVFKRGEGAPCSHRLERQLESGLVGDLGTLWILALRTRPSVTTSRCLFCRASSFHRSILSARRPPESFWSIGSRRCLRSVEHSCPGEFAIARATPRSAARRSHRASIF